MKHPAPTTHLWKDTAHRHFQRWAHHYDRDLINFVLFNPTHRRVLAQLRHWQRRGLKGVNLLDVGCGTGNLLLRAARLPGLLARGAGLDMSDNMISYACAKIGRAGFDHVVHVVVGDAERLPFPDASFDVVTCCNSFHHYPHQDQAVGEMRRVLRPGGQVILVDGHRDDPLGYVIFDVCVARAEGHVRHCSAQRFRHLLAAVGFSPIRQQVFGICPPILCNVARTPL